MTVRFSIGAWRRGENPGEPDIVELTNHFLDQIDRHDRHLQAWERVDRAGAIRQARKLAREFQNGELRGPLHGVPIGVKDIVDVAGLPTGAGSPLFAGRIAASDAPAVACLRTAGAIILGKTVTTELACFDPARTRNPYDAEHTPGGSSSGSAAAVAAGMCAAAIGSQTGGSIIRPASYCGIAGWKGAIGAVSTQGVTPVSFTLDHVGPIAGSAADLAILVSALESQPVPERLVSPPRLSVMRGYFDEHLGGPERVLHKASLETLQAAGAEVCELSLPTLFADVHRMHWIIMAVEAAKHYGEQYHRQPGDFSPHVASLIADGLDVPATDYTAALEHRQRFQKQLQESWPSDLVVVTPSTPAVAPHDLTTTGDPRFNAPWSYCGYPTATIPNGLTTGMLPTGMQFVAAPQQANLCLQTAIWCEQQLPAIPAPPIL